MTTRKPARVLVTGAQGALGEVVARRFSREGCEVFGLALPGAAGARKADFAIQWLEADASDVAAVAAKIPRDIDTLVHCAGGFRFAKLEELRNEDFEFLLNANFKSAFVLARHLVPTMKERNFGRIVFVGAKATANPGIGMGAYAASKAAINMLTLSLAEEVKGFDINVNAVLPSILDTPANRADMPQADASKWVAPVELAEIMFSLTQPWGRAIHGALIPVSGRV